MRTTTPGAIDRPEDWWNIGILADPEYSRRCMSEKYRVVYEVDGTAEEVEDQQTATAVEGETVTEAGPDPLHEPDNRPVSVTLARGYVQVNPSSNTPEYAPVAFSNRSVFVPSTTTSAGTATSKRFDSSPRQRSSSR